jgi:hypothetical protein
MLSSEVMYSLEQNSSNSGPSSASRVTHPSFPRFQGAELTELSPTELCRNCNNLISFEYFRINGQMVCPSCAVQARTGQSSDSQVAYALALFFGIGGAIVGSILYAGFAIATHTTLGYLTLVVAWIVGKSMKYGSNGLGGGRYQFTAVVLTYLAVSLAAIPVNLYEVFSQSGSSTNWAGLLNQVPLWALTSPFLGLGTDLVATGIRMAMLFLGLCVAWRMTQPKPLSVAGPYCVTAP